MDTTGPLVILIAILLIGISVIGGSGGSDGDLTATPTPELAQLGKQTNGSISPAASSTLTRSPTPSLTSTSTSTPMPTSTPIPPPTPTPTSTTTLTPTPTPTSTTTPTPTPTPVPTATPNQFPKVEWSYECQDRLHARISWRISVLGSRSVTERIGADTWESDFPRTLKITGTETHSRELRVKNGRWIELYLGKKVKGEPWSRYEVTENACRGYSK